MKSVTYKDSGVDLEVYAESMSRLPKLLHSTFSDRVMRLDGGFAGLYRLFDAKHKYDDPVLISCTDGVGTKLKIASLVGKHDTVGIDLVAMSVNDAICCGAEPLFFLDYVAMPKDDPDLLEQIVTGIVAGCKESGCALLGGETAILSDMYQPNDYDLAGFCVGVADRPKIIDGNAIQNGDVLIGVASSGLHSNGYSLVRKIVFDVAKCRIDDVVPECTNSDSTNLGSTNSECASSERDSSKFGEQTVADVLLTPTRIYVKTVQKLLAEFGANEGIRGISHITGGGLEENLCRIIPKNRKSRIEQTWSIPPVFSWIQRLGNVDTNEMNRVFNMGIGLVLVVRPDLADSVCRCIEFPTWQIGSVE
ncbi:MAG: phosphoribosylformylglycinamidine cyclo-ligase [Thermoguttaceae bacterium]